MSMFSSFLSALKSEIDWVISSLPFVSTAADDQASGDASAAGDRSTANAAADHANVGNLPDAKGTEIASIVDTHADNAPAHHLAGDLSAQDDYLHRVHDDANDAGATPSNSGGLLLAAPLQFDLFNSGNLNLDLFSNSSSNFALHGGGQSFDSGHLGGAAPLQFEPFNSGNLNMDLFSNSSSNFALYGDSHSGTFTTASLNQGSQSHGGGPGGKAMPTYDEVSADGHLKINLIWDSSVANAPIVNGINVFQSDVKAAATYLTSQFHDDATINITIGYGTIAGSRVPASALGESITNLVDHIDPNNQPLTFANLSSQLASDAAKDGWTITYPGSDPTLSGHFWVTTAEAKALGWTPIAQETLTATNNNGGAPTSLDIDGHIGLSSFKNIFDYTSTGATDTVGTGQYDFYATVLHEMTEVMGRMVFAGTSVNGAANSYEPLDLFRFQNGSPDVSSTKGGYFSIDGGTSPGLHDFNDSGGDYADWASTQGADAFNASGSPGVVETSFGALPDFDLQVMDAIGWDHHLV